MQHMLNVTVEHDITDVSLAPVSKVCTSAMLLLQIVGNSVVWCCGGIQSHKIHTKFCESLSQDTQVHLCMYCMAKATLFPFWQASSVTGNMCH